MRAGQRSLGSHTAFVDSISGETVLEMASDSDGTEYISYRLYDATGTLAADSKGFKPFPRGLSVKCKGGEVLLHIPKKVSEPMQYRLYGAGGNLLTWSDGKRTRILGVLRMNGSNKGWSLPEDGPPIADE